MATRITQADVEKAFKAFVSAVGGNDNEKDWSLYYGNSSYGYNYSVMNKSASFHRALGVTAKEAHTALWHMVHALEFYAKKGL